MKHKFKVGDRVNVYTFNTIIKGTVRNINNNILTIEHIMSYGNYHYKQCRRLIKQESHIFTNVNWDITGFGLVYPNLQDNNYPDGCNPYKQFVGKKTKVTIKVCK